MIAAVLTLALTACGKKTVQCQLADDKTDSTESTLVALQTEVKDEQQSEAKSVEDESIETFFTEVFNKEYYNDEGFIEKYCTDKMKKKLKEAYDYEGEGYAVWLFRSDAQDGEGESKLTKFTPEGGGWYRYEFDDRGTKGSHRIKFIVHETPRGNTETYIDDLQ